MVQVGDNFDTFSAIEARCGVGEVADGILTAQELLERLHSQGYEDVTDDQLTRWHKQDCLPRPHQDHPIGRGRRTTSCYPPHTLPQALACLRLQQVASRSFDQWRVLLWLDGYPIPIERVHASLQGLTEHTFEAFHVRWSAHWHDSHHIALAAMNLAQQVLPKLSRTRFGSRIKRTMSRSEQLDYLTAQFRLLAGDAPGFDMTHSDTEQDRSLTALVVSVYGLERAQTDVIGIAKPWLPSHHEVGQTLFELAKRRVFTPKYALTTIKQATPQALRQASVDRQLLLTQFPMLAQCMEEVFGDNALGLGIFRLLADWLPKDDAIAQTLIIVITLVVRRSGYGGALDQIATSVRSVVAAYQRWRAIRAALEHELPEVAAAIASVPSELLVQVKRQKRRTDYNAYLQAQLLRIKEIADSHRHELDAFFERHSEFTAESSEPPIAPDCARSL